ncbi:dialkylresorcinol condensing enzyme DarA [Chryseolinea sp. T2]|uniref:dialkylrecorsinol condensing enzyme DarA n=1 Tax=Chryseolinea sp. T2 TaxID=3129255 RepID=UPI003076D192
MKKRVLMLYYSQSGQQLSILQSLAAPLVAAGHDVKFEVIQPLEKYPFPWSAYTFFNAFPETFQQKPLDLKPLTPAAFEPYDLIVLGYQPWFLSPSRPIGSFLQSDEGKRILSNKNVVTILGCRNMWLGAQEKVKRRLIDAKAHLRGHIALVDRSGNLISLITILRWLLTGKKGAFLFFPPAGVSEADIREAGKFGVTITQALERNEYSNLQNDLLRQGAIEVKPSLVLLEKRGQKGFSVWSRFIASGGSLHSTGRKIRVYTFLWVLLPAIFVLSPLLWTLSKIMLMTNRRQLSDEVSYYRQTSLR